LTRSDSLTLVGMPLGEGGRVLIFVCEVILLGVGDKRLLVCKFPLRHRLSPTPVFLGFPFHRWRLSRRCAFGFPPSGRAPLPLARQRQQRYRCGFLPSLTLLINVRFNFLFNLRWFTSQPE
jgi:hypothetical protein